MVAFLVRRILQFIPVLFLASLTVWALIYAVPGNPAAALTGTDAPAAQIAAMAARMGLDRPIAEQYGIWLSHAVKLDFGDSVISHSSVSELLLGRIPATLQLAFLSMLLGLAIAFPIGILAALRPASLAARVVNLYEAVALAIPTFWVGILLIIFLSIRHPLFPAVSNYIPVWEDPVGAFRNTFLPALTLAIYIAGIMARFLTSGLRETLSKDFVRTARAKGVSERKVVSTHALRNAMLPTVTVVGLQLGVFLGGTVVTEAVFSYPGLGRLIYSAVTARDYPVVQGSVLFIVVAFLVINLLVDILYAYLDPRVKLS